MTTITDDMRLRLHPGICIQEMGPEERTVVLSLETGDLFTCNETTCDMLRLVEVTPRSFREIVDEMLNRYDVERDRLTGDIRSLAEKAVDEQLLVVVE